MSALIADGPPSRLIEEVIEGHIEMVLPDLVLDELARVLRAKLGFSATQIGEIQTLLRDLATDVPETPDRAESVTGDPADDRVLACAVQEGVDALVSGGSRHLLPLGDYRGLRIVKPQAFLAKLSE